MESVVMNDKHQQEAGLRWILIREGGYNERRRWVIELPTPERWTDYCASPAVFFVSVPSMNVELTSEQYVLKRGPTLEWNRPTEGEKPWNL